MEKLRKHDINQPVIIEGPIKVFLNEVETSIYVLRSENKPELDAREKRNLKFDPKWTRLISNKEWFADFYGKDLETGAELFGVKKGRKYFGASGVTDYLFNTNNLALEGTHEKSLIFPIEEEPYEKLAFDLRVLNIIYFLLTKIFLNKRLQPFGKWSMATQTRSKR